MQLTFIILVLCCYFSNSNSSPPPQSDSTWRPSRYIIDNRRNSLFSKKPLLALLQPSQVETTKDSTNFRYNPEAYRQTLYPVGRYQKDLTADASISEPKFYQKFGENSLPPKFLKSYPITETLRNPSAYEYSVGVYNRKNASEELEPQNYIQADDEVWNEVASKEGTTTEKMLTWVPKINEGLISSTVTAAKNEQTEKPATTQEFGYRTPTTTSFPWELSQTKTEEGNQIDNSNEKHVYETRIETVSFHQEVMFNPQKKHNWYREEQTPRNYETPEQNYEEPEKNYEEPEKNYEEPEKNYEEPEKNYEEPEKHYEPVIPEGGIPNENPNKFGYVVEGTNYRKYRVEERTVDGFIVGEYGVVSHDDGSLRGVRYTADGQINPKLIYETLIKFLSL